MVALSGKPFACLAHFLLGRSLLAVGCSSSSRPAYSWRLGRVQVRLHTRPTGYSPFAFGVRFLAAGLTLGVVRVRPGPTRILVINTGGCGGFLASVRDMGVTGQQQQASIVSADEAVRGGAGGFLRSTGGGTNPGSSDPSPAPRTVPEHSVAARRGARPLPSFRFMTNLRKQPTTPVDTSSRPHPASSVGTGYGYLLDDREGHPSSPAPQPVPRENRCPGP